MPRIRVRDENNSLRTVARIRMRDGIGILRNIQRIRMRDAGNVLRTVYTGLAATASTPITFVGPPPITGGPSTVTVTGGTAPFTYLWRAYLDDPATYNPDGINIVSPTSNATNFSRSFLVAGESVQGFFECVVTDALGATVITNMVTVTLTRS